MERSQTRHAVTDDDVHIAYQIVGDGPIDVVYVPFSTDARSVLPVIQVPTAVIVRVGWPGVRIEESLWTAEQIPGAEVVRLSGDEDEAYLGDGAEVSAVVRRFAEAIEEEHAAFDRVLATVLFTDIVSSSERAAALGDRAWKQLVQQHHAKVRALLARYRGQEVDTAGDGFFATFDGPGRAVRCAQAIVRSVSSLGIEVRAGVHTGEVETIDGKAGGIAVVIGARIGGKAGPRRCWLRRRCGISRPARASRSRMPASTSSRASRTGGGSTG